jgi:hypothetical protein
MFTLISCQCLALVFILTVRTALPRCAVGSSNFVPISITLTRDTHACHVQVPRHAEQWFRFFLLRRLVNRVLWLLTVLLSYMTVNVLGTFCA